MKPYSMIQGFISTIGDDQVISQLYISFLEHKVGYLPRYFDILNF